mmetsp:Transcript_5205/g.11540  ORF Transcript_5205/g.11540 Transcript_5205/m.11540 type:complete len:222 (-) Transcript_5205:575-1240(-)
MESAVPPLHHWCPRLLLSEPAGSVLTPYFGSVVGFTRIVSAAASARNITMATASSDAAEGARHLATGVVWGVDLDVDGHVFARGPAARSVPRSVLASNVDSVLKTDEVGPPSSKLVESPSAPEPEPESASASIPAPVAAAASFAAASAFAAASSSMSMAGANALSRLDGAPAAVVALAAAVSAEADGAHADSERDSTGCALGDQCLWQCMFQSSRCLEEAA